MKNVLSLSLPLFLLRTAGVKSFSSSTILIKKKDGHAMPVRPFTTSFRNRTSRDCRGSITSCYLKDYCDEETDKKSKTSCAKGEAKNSPSDFDSKATSPDKQQNIYEYSENSRIETNSLPLSDLISNTLLSPQIEIMDTFLVLVSSFFVALGTLPASSIPQGMDSMIIFVQDALTYVFGFAFFLRWYGVGKLSLEYLTKPLAILDIFVSVIPLIGIVPALGFINIPTSLLSSSALANLRLLRILRLARVLTDLETFGRFEIALGLEPSAVKSYQLELAKVLLSIFTLLSVATGLIYSAEHQYNPQIPDYFTALYFGLTTLTTVGFGDITPVTFNGRLVVMASILFGVTVIPAQAAQLFEALLEFQEERKRENQSTGMKQKTENDKRWGETLLNDDHAIIRESEIRRESEIMGLLKNQQSNQEQGGILDPRISCKSCGARSHRIDAIHCYLCGEKLL